MTPIGLQPRPGQAEILWGGEEGDHAGRRAPPAQGAEQPGGKLTPANKATRTPSEAVQVGPTGSAFPVRPRPAQQPLPPAPPPNPCNRLSRRADTRLPGVARPLRHPAGRIARSTPVCRQAYPTSALTQQLDDAIAG